MKTIFWNCDCKEKELNKLDFFASENGYKLVRTSSGFSEEHYGIFSSGSKGEPYEINMDDLGISYSKIDNSKEINIQRNGANEFLSNPHSYKVAESLNPDRVIVYGHDIEETIKGFRSMGKEVYVPIDSIKTDLKGNKLEKRLRKWEFHGVKLTKMEDVIEYLNW